tara:strand:- start:74655 stop:74867 length:213 start_codon:yes stop_codon:yes gene_type:complete
MFKVGQRVRCVDASEHGGTRGRPLKSGNIYTIIGARSNLRAVKLSEVDRLWWLPSRFVVCGGKGPYLIEF